jgi:hypothetical protein
VAEAPATVQSEADALMASPRDEGPDTSDDEGQDTDCLQPSDTAVASTVTAGAEQQPGHETGPQPEPEPEGKRRSTAAAAAAAAGERRAAATSPPGGCALCRGGGREDPSQPPRAQTAAEPEPETGPEPEPEPAPAPEPEVELDSRRSQGRGWPSKPRNSVPGTFLADALLLTSTTASQLVGGDTQAGQEPEADPADSRKDALYRQLITHARSPQYTLSSLAEEQKAHARMHWSRHPHLEHGAPVGRWAPLPPPPPNICGRFGWRLPMQHTRACRCN